MPFQSGGASGARTLRIGKSLPSRLDAIQMQPPLPLCGSQSANKEQQLSRGHKRPSRVELLASALGKAMHYATCEHGARSKSPAQQRKRRETAFERAAESNGGCDSEPVCYQRNFVCLTKRSDAIATQLLLASSASQSRNDQYEHDRT